jgi:hypothetical protein
VVEMWGTVFCVTLEGGAGGVMILFRNRIWLKIFIQKEDLLQNLWA